MTRDQILQIGEIILGRPREKIALFLQIAEMETEPLEVPLKRTKPKSKSKPLVAYKRSLKSLAREEFSRLLQKEMRDKVSLRDIRLETKSLLVRRAEKGLIPHAIKTISSEMSPTGGAFQRAISSIPKGWTLSQDKSFLVREEA